MRRIQILHVPSRVKPPEGLVYSTDPHVGLGDDGHRYYLKGPDLAVTVAEATAYLLADLIGLGVPPCAICSIPPDGRLFLGSREISLRSGLELLLLPGHPVHRPFLANCIAFDVWIANVDRNINNVVAQPLTDAKPPEVRLHAIDFEKAHVLRGTPFTEVAMMEPRKFWPGPALAEHCRGLPVPVEFCRVIEANASAVGGVFDRVAESLGTTIPWRDSAVRQLGSRAARLLDDVKEVWRARAA